jgi:hypothetical protein
MKGRAPPDIHYTHHSALRIQRYSAFRYRSPFARSALAVAGLLF